MTTIVPRFNRALAQHDIKRAGAEIRLIDGQLFQVKKCAPADNLDAWLDAIMANHDAWVGMRTQGANPTLWDCGDPQTLALVVERNHDYPGPDDCYL